MAREIDKIFYSKNGKASFQIASGYISETAVLFEQENIIALIHAEGRVAFYDQNDSLLAVGEVPSEEGGRKVYEEVCCQAEGNLISLQFPIYEWIDNYPNCDGEYDRWTTRTIGYQILTFDRTNNSVTYSGAK